MEETEDPGLMTLVQDVLSVVYFIIYVLRGFLTVSYIIGKYTVEFSVWTGQSIWEGFCMAADGVKLVFDAIIELEQSLIRGVVLVHYSIGRIFDAFEVTLFDIAEFLGRFKETCGRLLHSFLSGFGTTVDAVTITVPQHICAALIIIGEFTLEVLCSTFGIVLDFCIQLIWSPIKVMLLLLNFVATVVTLPVKAIAAVPFSAHVGSVVLLLFYIIYCKLSFFRLVNFLITCGMALHRFVKRVPSLLGQIRKLLLLPFSRLSDNLDDGIYRGDLKGICVVCHENIVSFLANPCNHVCLCERCVRVMMEHDDRCPMCRKRVNHYSKVYVS